MTAKSGRSRRTARPSASVARTAQKPPSLSEAIASALRPRNPFPSLATKITRSERYVIPDIDIPPPEGCLRLALVSLAEIRHLPHSRWLSRDAFDKENPPPSVGRRLATYSRTTGQRMERAVRSAITAAVGTHRANIICVNELGFPAFNGTPSSTFGEELRTIASGARAMIVAGTSHNALSLYNTAHIFTPQVRTMRGGKASLRACPSLGIESYKHVVSREAREEVSVPSDRRFFRTRAFGLNIAVLTCMDICDYSSICAVVRDNDERDGHVHLLLVPCYSQRFETMLDVGRQISEAMPGVVAMANYMQGKTLSTAVFRFDSSACMTHAVEDTSIEGAIMRVYSIDVARLERDVRTHYGMNDHLSWLFGHGDMVAR